MSVDGILFFQYEDPHPLAYKKSFFSLSSYWYMLIRSLTLFMVNYFPFISVDFHISTCFRVHNLDYVLFCYLSHVAPFSNNITKKLSLICLKLKNLSHVEVGLMGEARACAP